MEAFKNNVYRLPHDDGQYNEMKNYRVNEIHNIANFYAHLLEEHSIPWDILSILVISQDESDSNERIFIKELYAWTRGLIVVDFKICVSILVLRNYMKN